MLSRAACRTSSPLTSAARAMATSDVTFNDKQLNLHKPAAVPNVKESESHRRVRIKERIQKRLQEQEAKATSENKQMFVQRVNPLSGAVEWLVVEEEINGANQQTKAGKPELDKGGTPVENHSKEWNQSVVQSSYLDMLNDAPRNKAYAQAIREEVRSGDLVLDIGTGTGLLSMLAAQALRDGAPYLTQSPETSNQTCHVSTCESFPPMASLAKTVVEANGLGHAVEVINKRSDELVVGELVAGADLPKRADLLLSEILDSELLGEGLLPTLRDAWARLLRPNARTIPRRARTFAQLVQCEYLRDCHDLAGREARLPDGVRIARGFGGLGGACAGKGPPAWAVHADAFGAHLKPLSAPFTVFDFDFADPPPGDRHVTVDVAAQTDGTAHGLITWWTIDLDEEGSITYSTSPRYAFSDGGRDALPNPNPKPFPNGGREALPYRGWHHHWRQCAWPFPGEGFRVFAGERIPVRASHDDLGFWYRAETVGLEEAETTGGLEINQVGLANVETRGLGFEERTHSSGCVSGAQNAAEQDGSLRADGATEHQGLSESGRPSRGNESRNGHVAESTWSCTCGAHEKQSPERIGQLGDATWRARMNAAVNSALASLPTDAMKRSKSRPEDRNRGENNEDLSSTEGPSEIRSESEAAGGPLPRNDRTEPNHPTEPGSAPGHGPISAGESESYVGPETSQLASSKTLKPHGESVVAGGSGRELHTRCSGESGSEDSAGLSNRNPVVLIADDSPLVPLLAARHLSGFFGRKPEQRKTEPLPESSNTPDWPTTEDSGFGESAKRDERTSVERNGSNARAHSTGRGRGRGRSAFRTPTETDGTGPESGRSRVPRVISLARGGLAAVEGFFEQRAGESGILHEFLPGRMEGIGGEVTAADLEELEVVALLAEPWYSSCESGPPWGHPLRFWHRRTILDSVIAPSASIVPQRGVLRGVPISAPELWDSRRALSRVEGFNHSAANRLLGACGASESNAAAAAAYDTAASNTPGAAAAASDADESDAAADCPILTFPAWQCGASYKELSEPFNLLTFDFSTPMTSLEGTAEVSLATSAPCHGVALWMEYHAGGDTTPLLSTRWSPGDGPSFFKQGIQLLQLPLKIDAGDGPPSSESPPTLRLHVAGSLDADSGKVQLSVRTPNGSCNCSL